MFEPEVVQDMKSFVKSKGNALKKITAWGEASQNFI